MAIDKFDDGAIREWYEDGEPVTLEKMQALEESWKRENAEQRCYGKTA